jgi:alpha-beta hydrolase superfamily lysophospholipase
MTISPDAAAPARATVRIPTASGDEIEAWVYRPEGDGPHPAIVLAHGFAAVKAGGLAPFAERFRSEGFTAIAFDYRQWGGSSGRPREEVSVPRQREDYRTVIAWALAQPDIDPTRVFVWGTSFSGLHAVEIAATDARLRGAIAQNPLVDGLAPILRVAPTRSLRLFGLGLLDRLGSLLGRPPRYVAEDDTIAPTGPAMRVADRAPQGELYHSRGGHYDVYEGGEDHDRVLNVEVEFLHRQARVATR